MPVVKIETRRGLSREQKKAVFDAVHAALVTAFKVEEHARNQRLVEYEPEDFEVSAGKGGRFMIVTIDALAGRSVDAKRLLYREMASRLGAVGVPPNDLVVVVHDIPLESWGTRGGQAACDIDLAVEAQARSNPTT
jgi:phenylpyruvate tautomerase PptA (4-oxalocrotonate tautomerase family)